MTDTTTTSTRNVFTTWLLWLWILMLAVGGLVWIFGNAEAQNSYGSSTSTTQMLAGGNLFTGGFATLVVWLAVRALLAPRPTA